MKYFDDPLHSLLLHCCFCHANNHLQSVKEMQEYEQDLVRKKRALFIEIDYIVLLLVSRRWIDFLDRCGKMVDRLSRKQNVNQQAKLKIYYACVLSELQKANLKQELASISQWIKENKNRMNPPIFLNVAYSLAMIYYNNLNDFTQSKNCLK